MDNNNNIIDEMVNEMRIKLAVLKLKLKYDIDYMLMVKKSRKTE